MFMVGIVIFGMNVPLWAIFIIGIIGLIVAWKVVKFAIKVLLISVVIFIILIGLDVLNVFNWIQNSFLGLI
jgi:hypothetical protein